MGSLVDPALHARNSASDASQDELAEHAIASPPYYEEDVSFDPYDYFADLEYNTDGYDDAPILVDGRREGLKRKRKKADNDASPRRQKEDKRGNPKLSHDATVLWRKREKVDDGKPPCNLAIQDPEIVALLQDWRERFRNNPGPVIPRPAPRSQPDNDIREDLREVWNLSDMLSSQTISDLKRLVQGGERGDLGSSEALQKIMAAGSLPTEHNQFDRKDGEASPCKLLQERDQLDRISESVLGVMHVHSTLSVRETSVSSVPVAALQDFIGDMTLSSHIQDCIESNQLQFNQTISTSSTSPAGRVTAHDASTTVDVSQRTRIVVEVRIPLKASGADEEGTSSVQHKVVSKLSRDKSSGNPVSSRGSAKPTVPSSPAVKSGASSKKRKAATEDGDGTRQTKKRICKEEETDSKPQPSECAVIQSQRDKVRRTRSTRSGKVWRKLS